MIKKAASENLKLIQPMIRALRSGDKDRLSRIKDLKPEWLSINHYVLKAEEPVQLYGKAAIEHSRAQNLRENMDLLVELMKLGEILGLGAAEAEKLGREILDTDLTNVMELKKLYAEKASKLGTQSKVGGKSKKET